MPVTHEISELMTNFHSYILRYNLTYNRLSFFRYGNQAQIEFYLDQYNTREEYINHIQGMRWLDQATNTSGGIYRMYNEVFQVGDLFMGTHNESKHQTI